MHLAMYFPGGYVPGQDPFDSALASITIRALEDAGAFVVPVRYDDTFFKPDGARFADGIRREVSGALAFHHPDRVTFPDADHGLEIPGDVLATLNTWRAMAEAIIAFASRR